MANKYQEKMNISNIYHQPTNNSVFKIVNLNIPYRTSKSWKKKKELRTQEKQRQMIWGKTFFPMTFKYKYEILKR